MGVFQESWGILKGTPDWEMPRLLKCRIPSSQIPACQCLTAGCKPSPVLRIRIPSQPLWNELVWGFVWYPKTLNPKP